MAYWLVNTYFCSSSMAYWLVNTYYCSSSMAYWLVSTYYWSSSMTCWLVWIFYIGSCVEMESAWHVSLPSTSCAHQSTLLYHILFRSVPFHRVSFLSIICLSMGGWGEIHRPGGSRAYLRYDARIEVEKALEELGLLRGKDPQKMRLGKCSRSGNIIEPMITPQWWEHVWLPPLPFGTVCVFFCTLKPI